MGDVRAALFADSVPIFGGIGLIMAVALIIALLLALPQANRRLLKTPIALVILYLLIFALERLLAPPPATAKVYEALQAFALLASIGRSVVLLALNSIFVRRFSGPVPTIVRDLLQGIIYLTIALIAMSIAGVEPGSILTTSALLTAVIGLSLQDTLGNLFSGLAIQAQRPFDVGDWIRFDGQENHLGEIVEMNWRTVTLRTIDQNEVTVPNAMLGKAAIINYGRPIRPARRTVSVWASSNVEPHRVHRLLLVSLKGIEGILADPAASVLTRDFTERGLHYEVRFFIGNFADRERISGEVRDRLWYALHRAQIDLPAPRREVFVHEVNEASVQQARDAQLKRRRDALRHVDFLVDVPEETRAQLAALSEDRVYAAGEVIIQQGESGSELFLIHSGEVSVEIRKRTRDKQVAKLGGGQFFGEMSLLTGEPRTATIRAISDTKVLVIDKTAFQVVLDAAPDLAETLSEALARREEQLGDAAALSTTDAAASIVARNDDLLRRIKRFFSLGST